MRSFKKWQNPWRSMGYREALPTCTWYQPPTQCYVSPKEIAALHDPLTRTNFFRSPTFVSNHPFSGRGSEFQIYFFTAPASLSGAIFTTCSKDQRPKMLLTCRGYDTPRKNERMLPGNFVQKEIHLPTIDFQMIFFPKKIYIYIVFRGGEDPEILGISPSKKKTECLKQRRLCKRNLLNAAWGIIFFSFRCFCVFLISWISNCSSAVLIFSFD